MDLSSAQALAKIMLAVKVLSFVISYFGGTEELIVIMVILILNAKVDTMRGSHKLEVDAQKAEIECLRSALSGSSVLLYEGGEVPMDIKGKLTRIHIGPRVTSIPIYALCGCRNLVELKFNEGLLTIGEEAFYGSKALRRVTLPSTLTELYDGAFGGCSNLAGVKLNEGLQTVGTQAFVDCKALQSVTLPSTLTKLGALSFEGCISLSQVIFLGDERLLNQEFLTPAIYRQDLELLNKEALDEILFDDDLDDLDFPFHDCPSLTDVKISISSALSERLARLSPECRVSVEGQIRNLPRLERMPDGNTVACFPLVTKKSDNGVQYEVEDTNLETMRSLYQMLQLIAFHELKESSILIELAMWKSKIDANIGEAMLVPGTESRASIPDPVKSAIMEYCGFAGFLKPAIEGSN